MKKKLRRQIGHWEAALRLSTAGSCDHLQTVREDRKWWCPHPGSRVTLKEAATNVGLFVRW